jgi:hypothetical protein
MKLIDDAGKLWHRLSSVWFAIVGVIYASAGGVWLAMPESFRPDLPQWFRICLAVIGVALAASPGIARVVAQPKLASDDTDKAGA